MTIEFWAWLLITGVLLAFELVQRDLLTAPFAAGAATAAALVALDARATVVWSAFLGVSIVLTVVAQRLIVPRRAPHQPPADQSAEDKRSA